MNYTFNVDMAVKYGLDEAIMIENLCFWIKKNEANNKNCFEGYYWTYNSTKAFSLLFPFWGEDKIYRLIKKLENIGVIKSGNYNQVKYDRTKRYTIIDKSILSEYKIHSAELQNGSYKIAEPIPDSNTDSNTDILSKDNTTTVESYGNIEINSLIVFFKQMCTKYGVIYSSERDRQFCRHLLSKKFKEEISDRMKVDSLEAVKLLFQMGIVPKFKNGQKNWRHGKISGPKDLYDKRTDILNNYLVKIKG